MLTISPEPQNSNIKRIQRATRYRITGARTLAGGAVEDVWSGAAAARPSLGGSVFEVVSADANDTAAGTGARTVAVIVAIGGVISVINLTLNGVTAVQGIAADDVLAVCVTSAGSGGVAAGEISVQVTAAGAVVAAIDAGKVASDDLVFRAPAGRSVIVDVDVSASTVATRISLEATVAPNGQAGTILVPLAQATERLRCRGVVVPAGALIRVRAEGVATTVVAGSMTALIDL